MRTSRLWERAVRRVEEAKGLDRVAEPAANALRKAVPAGPVEDVLSGVPIGHPLHPALVAVPLGAWTTASVLDLTGEPDAARHAVALGCLSALPAAAAGASDWLNTSGAERRVGLVHAAANYGALALYAASWWVRRSGRHGRGAVLSLAGAALASAGGALGGHLAYALGVGVDTTAFTGPPTDWTDAAAEADLPRDGSPAQVRAGDVPLLAAWHDGRWAVLADRCVHRGAPLHEGTVEDGCVTCPWHGSVFSLDDGAVRSGPATYPQPVFETRVRDGRLEVRRSEERSLRANPV